MKPLTASPTVAATRGSIAGQGNPSAPTVDIRSLERRFGAKDVVRSLSLLVGSGERLAFRGRNGSGKTTVLRCIAGTLTPSAGTVSVCGLPAGSHQARRLVGVSLAQERSFYLRLSGHTNLLFFARLRYASDRQASTAVASLEEELELRSIAAERADRCSAGMLQQLAFARALLGNPSLLLLDEPTRSLDPFARERLWGALDRRLGTTVVIATHSPEDLEHCDRCIDFPV